MTSRLTAAALASTVLLVATAPSALAAGKVRLHDGCFNASYRDGFASTTLYYRNACRHAHRVKIFWKGGTNEVRSVRGHHKGHSKRFHGSAPTIKDLGRA